MEYDFKMQTFIILNQKQKFYNSPKIADFLKKMLHFLQKVFKHVDSRSDILSFIDSSIKLPNLQWNIENIRKVICFALI